MRNQYSYGARHVLSLDGDNAIRQLAGAWPEVVPLADPAAATRRALAVPLDFPPLAEALVAGDHVAIAVEPGVPQATAVVQGLVEELLAQGVLSEHITVVYGAWAGGATETPPPSPAPGVAAIVHRGDDAQSLAYLAATDDADPIYLPRVLCDADLVIPVGVRRGNESFGYLGIAGSIYPAFSDGSARRRMRPADRADWRKQAARMRKEASHALWLLGIQFVVQVIPGPQESVVDVIAGQVDAVAQRSGQRFAEVWRGAIPEPADLVVACLDGGEEQQTWDNVVRALALASEVVADGGLVVVCTELQDVPCPDEAEAEVPAELAERRGVGKGRRAARRRSGGSLATRVIAELARSHRVGLLSGLAAETVEELGCIPVAQDADILRLGKVCRTGVVIPAAQYAMLAVQSRSDGS